MEQLKASSGFICRWHDLWYLSDATTLHV